MSERSSFSGGARANPLYGGPSSAATANSGGRAPSWVKKSSSGAGGGNPRNSTSAYSDAASSPPDSPPRSGRSNYGPSSSSAAYYGGQPYDPPPTYTVQTPGHYGAGSLPTESPSRASGPGYYVQTPARLERSMSDDEDDDEEQSPYSSPRHSPPRSVGTNGTPFDARSTRSARSKSSTRMAAATSISKIDEEAEEFFPDAERDAWRRRRFWKCCTGWASLVLILGLVAGCITVWILFEPQQPTYTYTQSTVNDFYVADGYDASGLPTHQLFINMSFWWSMRNPNTYYTTYFDGGTVALGFSSIPVVAQGQLPSFYLNPGKRGNFTNSVGAMAFPLYGAGPLLAKAAYETKFVQLNVNAYLYSHVQMVWLVLRPSYATNVRCIISMDPYTFQSINSTCNS